MTGGAEQKAYVAGVFDRAAATYQQTGVRFFDLAGAALVAAAGLRPGQRVLDVGCGRGASLFPAGDAVTVAGAVAGIDLAPGMVAATAAEIKARSLRNVRVQVGDAEAPNFPDASFDAVLAGFVIFFLPDPAAAVRAYFRLLRPGGRVALSTFCEVTEQEQARMRKLLAAVAAHLPAPPPTSSEGPPPEQRFRTRQSVIDLLEAASFTEVTCTECTYQVEFTGSAQYWDWLWSGGLRGMLEQIPAARLEDARRGFLEAAEELRTPDGNITLPTSVRLTSARRPT